MHSMRRDSNTCAHSHSLHHTATVCTLTLTQSGHGQATPAPRLSHASRCPGSSRTASLREAAASGLWPRLYRAPGVCVCVCCSMNATFRAHVICRQTPYDQIIRDPPVTVYSFHQEIEDHLTRRYSDMGRGSGPRQTD